MKLEREGGRSFVAFPILSYPMALKAFSKTSTRYIDVRQLVLCITRVYTIMRPFPIIAIVIAGPLNLARRPLHRALKFCACAQ